MILTKGKQPLNIISLCAVITIFLGSWLCDVTSDVWAEIKDTRNVSKQPPSGEKVKYNRLIHESSPYLLQHATNPVNWFPWGDEAFERATKEDKPIFLSIGYSTCHWCHVMEHESFADQEVADLLNKYFISIKVDREERPDIDQVYMSVTQALTGSGGWPMTIVMTPDKKPFFAGTYFPKNSRWGRSGMMELLPKIAEAWRMEQEKILAGAEQITQHVIGLNERSATAFPRKGKAHSSVKR